MTPGRAYREPDDPPGWPGADGFHHERWFCRDA